MSLKRFWDCAGKYYSLPSPFQRCGIHLYCNYEMRLLPIFQRYKITKIHGIDPSIYIL